MPYRRRLCISLVASRGPADDIAADRIAVFKETSSWRRNVGMSVAASLDILFSFVPLFPLCPPIENCPLPSLELH
jgi:hypothetical protein